MAADSGDGWLRDEDARRDEQLGAGENRSNAGRQGGRDGWESRVSQEQGIGRERKLDGRQYNRRRRLLEAGVRVSHGGSRPGWLITTRAPHALAPHRQAARSDMLLCACFLSGLTRSDVLHSGPAMQVMLPCANDHVVGFMVDPSIYAVPASRLMRLSPLPTA